MVTTHFHIVTSGGKAAISFFAGLSWRFALGFGIDRYTFTLEVGPLWLTIEW